MNLVTPWIAKSVILMIVSRCVLGLFQTGIYPAGYGMLCNWFPQHERPAAISIFMNGFAVALFIVDSLAGYVSEYVGWPYVFYICALINLVFLAIFVPTFTSKPERSRFVGKRELAKIQNGQEVVDSSDSSKCKSRSAVPWKAMLTSRNVIAYLVHCVFNIRGTVMDAKFPAYLSEILHMRPSQVPLSQTKCTNVQMYNVLSSCCRSAWPCLASRLRHSFRCHWAPLCPSASCSASSARAPTCAK